MPTGHGLHREQKRMRRKFPYSNVVFLMAIFAVARSVLAVPFLVVDFSVNGSRGGSAGETIGWQLCKSDLQKGNGSHETTTFSNDQIKRVFGGNTPLSKSVAPTGRLAFALTSVDLSFLNGQPTILNDGASIRFSDRGSMDSGGKVGALYHSFIVATAGSAMIDGQDPGLIVADDGANHRMLIQISGLKANSSYVFTFYAYDEAARQSVCVFTNVTGDPLRHLNAADASANRNYKVGMPNVSVLFNPGLGEHDDGTQYAHRWPIRVG